VRVGNRDSRLAWEKCAVVDRPVGSECLFESGKVAAQVASLMVARRSRRPPCGGRTKGVFAYWRMSECDEPRHAPRHAARHAKKSAVMPACAPQQTGRNHAGVENGHGARAHAIEGVPRCGSDACGIVG